MKITGTVIDEGLELRRNSELGYHVVARRDLPMGALIAQEAPLVLCPAASALRTHCRHCLGRLTARQLPDPIRCERCRGVVYCSGRCEEEDLQLHQGSGECALLLEEQARPELGPFCREACLALRLHHAEPLDPPLHTNDEQLLPPDGEDGSGEGGGSSSSGPGQQLWAVVRRVAAAMRAVSLTVSGGSGGAVAAAPTPADGSRGGHAGGGGEGGGGGGDGGGGTGHQQGAGGWCGFDAAARRAVASVVTNGLEVQGVLLGVEGVGRCAPHIGDAAAVYRMASRLNHSCRPTLSYYFKGAGHVLLRALTPIKRGQQMTIAYCTLMAPPCHRRAGLRQRYCFDCRCERCRAADDAVAAGAAAGAPCNVGGSGGSDDDTGVAGALPEVAAAAAGAAAAPPADWFLGAVSDGAGGWLMEPHAPSTTTVASSCGNACAAETTAAAAAAAAGLSEAAAPAVATSWSRAVPTARGCGLRMAGPASAEQRGAAVRVSLRVDECLAAATELFLRRDDPQATRRAVLPELRAVLCPPTFTTAGGGQQPMQVHAAAAHPLHHQALEAYACLSSCCRVAALQAAPQQVGAGGGGDSPGQLQQQQQQQEEGGGAKEGVQEAGEQAGEQGAEDGQPQEGRRQAEGGGSQGAGMDSADAGGARAELAAAVLFSLLPVLAASRLLAGGEYGVLQEAGRMATDLALLLYELLAHQLRELPPPHPLPSRSHCSRARGAPDAHQAQPGAPGAPPPQPPSGAATGGGGHSGVGLGAASDDATRGAESSRRGGESSHLGAAGDADATCGAEPTQRKRARIGDGRQVNGGGAVAVPQRPPSFEAAAAAMAAALLPLTDGGGGESGEVQRAQHGLLAYCLLPSSWSAAAAAAGPDAPVDLDQLPRQGDGTGGCHAAADINAATPAAATAAAAAATAAASFASSWLSGLVDCGGYHYPHEQQRQQQQRCLEGQVPMGSHLGQPLGQVPALSGGQCSVVGKEEGDRRLVNTMSGAAVYVQAVAHKWLTASLSCSHPMVDYNAFLPFNASLPVPLAMRMVQVMHQTAQEL